nr:aspartyl-phosphate phosphatase Spo0E family protein [Paenibacillus alvei]
MEEIDLCRLALEKRVLRLGISHPEVVEFSQMLDKLIILVQRSSG